MSTTSNSVCGVTHSLVITPCFQRIHWCALVVSKNIIKLMYCSCLDTIYDPEEKKCSVTNVLVLLHNPFKKNCLKITQTEKMYKLVCCLL